MRKIIDDAFISMLETRDLNVHSSLNGLFGGNRRTVKHGSSAEFADYQEYVPGDDLRRIDWNLYARFEKLYIKLFVDERQLHHRIYVDCSASMDWGDPHKGETALKLAAALGFLAVQSMDRVSIILMHDDKCDTVARTVVGKERFYEAVDKLNGTEFYGSSELGKALSAEEDVGNGDGMSVIISDFLTESEWKSGAEYLRYNNREVCLLQVLSPEETDPLMMGKMWLLDSEAKGTDDHRNKRMEITRDTLKAYALALDYHQKELKQFCDMRGIPFVTVRTDEPIEQILFMKSTEAGIIL
ncbi:MAG: DUF58 domain-containing protein [Oscillospiraceae bacterium]|nr:DUF58 domain-containing protein [Oscillospiraceae bacterium]MBQ4240187.1 DUF58 domain-containing protein [Oscillospiraceae bacterium]